MSRMPRMTSLIPIQLGHEEDEADVACAGEGEGKKHALREDPVEG